jgi:hypothetical protein
VTGMALAHCILGKFLGVVCDGFPPPLDFPTYAARCLYVRNDARDPSSERLNCGREICPVILPKFRHPRKFRDLLHAANLRHGTDSFTSPPKEGVLKIFFALKIRRLRPGLNPRTWVLKASTLPLDHRSLSHHTTSFNKRWPCKQGMLPSEENIAISNGYDYDSRIIMFISYIPL